MPTALPVPTAGFAKVSMIRAMAATDAASFDADVAVGAIDSTATEMTTDTRATKERPFRGNRMGFIECAPGGCSGDSPYRIRAARHRHAGPGETKTARRSRHPHGRDASVTLGPAGVLSAV